MPAIQDSQKIGVGNSLKLLLGIQKTPGGFWELPPDAARDASSAVHFRTFIIFHVYFWLEPELGIHELSLSAFFPLFFFFLTNPFVSLREKEACSLLLQLTLGFKEAGPCNCKLPMKKTKPLAPFLVEAWRSAVIVGINESCCWAPGLLVAAEMKRLQLKSALGMSIPIRICVQDTVITHAMGPARPQVS